MSFQALDPDFKDWFFLSVCFNQYFDDNELQK